MLVVAYLLLGIGVLVANGTLPGLPFALAAVAILVFALVRGSSSWPRTLPWIIAFSGALVLTRSPAAGPLGWALVPLAVAQASLGIAACAPRWRGARFALPAALGLYAVSGALLIARAPAPRVDVFVLEQEGARSIAAGRDPYAVTFSNPYTKEETRKFFGDERTALREYPYPPLSLLVTTLGYAIGGDVRWTLLAAQLAIAALLFALAKRAGHAEPTALASISLLHPRGLFVLEQAWTDSLIACAFLLVLLAIQRRSARWLGLAIGLFVATKQYSAIAVPLLVRDGSVGKRQWLEALAAATLVTLPFFIWSPADFVGDVVLFQLRQPFRADAMSLPALVAALTPWHPPGILALGGAAAGAAVAWPRLGPSSGQSRLPLATAVVFAGFFLFAKQAFCNYYYFVGVLVLASAALLEPPGAPSGR